MGKGKSSMVTEIKERLSYVLLLLFPLGTEQYLLEKSKNTGLQEGIQKGAKQSKEQTVKNLIEQLDIDDSQIAGIVEVSVDFVKKVRAALKK